MTEEELEKIGYNNSKNHVDLMVGTNDLNTSLMKHIENDADESENRGEGCGLQKLKPEAVALDGAQAEQPGGDRCTDIGTHDDTDGLPQRHESGIDKSHHHDGGSRGGLDHGGHAQSQKESAEGGGCHAAENRPQAAARPFFQSVAHDVHAIQKQHQTTDQTKSIENRH